MTLEFRVLGPLEVLHDGVPLPVGRPRERALLALLLLRAGTAVPRERLVDELWPDDPPESAVNVLQTYVSHLRKALPADRLVTRPPGYALEVGAEELDLHRFEHLLETGRLLLAGGDAEGASGALGRALALWRGEALADVRELGVARIEAARLEELRLAALEERVDADLALGRHARLTAELEALVAGHPLRERFRAQLMVALYRSGRQPEALAAYRAARATLADQLGIEPGQGLRDLEVAILRQDPSLAPSEALPEAGVRRSVVVACLDDAALAPMLTLAEPLAGRPRHEVVLVRIVADADALPGAAALADRARMELGERGVLARSAAFTSATPADDVVRLAEETDAALLLLDASGRLDADGRLDEPLSAVLAGAPCDVALVAGGRGGGPPGAESSVLVPFGGEEHEWAAAEVGAWIAQAEGRPLELAGTAGDDGGGGRRDASRLLASVALLIQQVADVRTVPTLVPAGDAVVALARSSRVVLVGLPDDWRQRGVGRTRAALALGAGPPVLLVRGGVRPGGISPPGSVTRFSWTVTTHRP